MGPPGKQLSPAEISALEHAFATDPASDAYRPLTEAYLAAARFMEAMVVCKKGVKAHPDDPSARVLLARVYADQGKDRKALEELHGVLAAFPTFVAANRLAATLHLRLGEREPGEAALRRAAEAAPNDPEILELLQKHGVKLAAPVAPGRPRTGPDAPPVAPRVVQGGRAQPGATSPDAQPDAPERSIEVPIPTPVPSRRSRDVAYAQALADKYGTSQYEIARGASPKKKSHRTMLVGSLGLALALAAALGGWSWKTRADADRARAIDALLKDVREQVEKDTYPAYTAAAKGAAEILEHDSTNVGGHAYLAYVDALRWSEHGDGEPARASAVQHLNQMLEVGRTHSHLYAAEAYLRAGGGDPAGAREGIEKAFAANPATQTPFLSAVLGAVQLRAGELDAAAATLKTAQEKGPGDARTAWLLAEQFRRRGEGYEAQAVNYYEYALRIQKDHVSSILGRAVVLLGRGQIEEASKSAELVLAPQTGASKPQRALARAIRGGVLAARGKPDAATAEEAEAAKLDPMNPDLPWLAGVRKLRAGDAPGAVEAFQRAIALDNKRVSLYADLTRAMLRKEGGVPQALDTLKRTVARLGESPRLSLLLGDAYRAAGDLDLARGNYKKAIELGRPFPDARVALARLHRAQNDIPSALVELTTAIDEYGAGGTGGVAAAYVEMAEAERARDAKPEKLKELYDRALEKDPASCEALWGAARARADLPKLKDVAEQRTQLLERYVRACPAGAHFAEARGMLGAK